MNGKEKKFVALGLGALIMVMCFGVLMSTNLGGSQWQFDYTISQLAINGKPLATTTTNYPGTVPTNTVSGGSGRNTAQMDVRNAYLWSVDVDGAPIYDGYQWKGLLPTVSVSTSLPWRVDENGNTIKLDAEPSRTVKTATDTLYTYYYAFSSLAEVSQKTFTVPGTVQTLFQAWQGVEAGAMDIDYDITVLMKQSVFNEVSGEFMSAKVLSVKVPDLQLQSGLTWRQAPMPTVEQQPNTGLPVANRQYADDYYSCDVHLACMLTPGVVQSGLNLMPYGIYCEKVIMVEMLLKEPLEVSGTGGAQNPLDLIKYYAPPDILTILLLVLGAVVLIVVLIVVYRVIGTYGLLHKVRGRR
jgi:hypothetical protein